MQPIDPALFRAMRDAFTAHQVIFFRDQDISIERQVAFGRMFGELAIHPNDPGLAGHPEVMIIHADEASKRVAGERWHSDVSCDAEPPMGSILRLHTVPASGGDTLFSSMYAAHDALSAPMRTWLATLQAEHDGAPYYRSVNAIIGRDDGGRLGVASEIVGMPDRGELVLRAGPYAAVAVTRHLEVVGMLLPVWYSPDSLGLIGADFGQLGIRLRYATDEKQPDPRD